METDKKLLRQEMRCIRNSLTKEEIAVKSQRIFKKICSNNVYKESEYIFSYVSFRNEVDTTWFHEKVFEDNKVLLLPKVLTKEKMEFYKVSDLDDLECSPMGIFEPKDTCKLFKIDQTPGLMILPGLAYDFSGARLGYGGGYYDRYLEEIQHNVIRCGVAFECQWIEKVPCKPHDVLMDIIVTDEKWIERMDVR